MRRVRRWVLPPLLTALLLVEPSAPAPPLTVLHFVPMSHIDPGWQRTYDGYYGDVDGILRAVLLELLVGPNRTFAWEGSAYLTRFLADREAQSQPHAGDG